MKDINYLVIHGWMINKLNLKGNSLLVFSIIFGFSQDGETKFTGSLKYLMESINASKNTVIKALTELVDQSLIIKEPIVKNNVTFNKYFVNEPVVQKLVHPGSENEPISGSSSEHNNDILNNSNKKPIEFKKELFPGEEIESLPRQVLRILNESKPGKSPFHFTRSNLSLIEARVKEGFVLDDFKRVIFFKISEWKDNEKMKKYIRPATFFGSKFDQYVVESKEEKTSNDGSQNFEYKPQEKAEMV